MDILRQASHSICNAVTSSEESKRRLVVGLLERSLFSEAMEFWLRGAAEGRGGSAAVPKGPGLGTGGRTAGGYRALGLAGQPQPDSATAERLVVDWKFSRKKGLH